MSAGRVGGHAVPADFDPNNADNHPGVEARWATLAMQHAETYMNLLKARDPKELRLTPLDAELYAHFRNEFPDLQVGKIDEEKLKAKDQQAKWREFCEKYRDTIKDYNFGTLLRLDSKGDYTPENTTFVVRAQFYAIEVARNKEGHNVDLP